MKLIAAQHALRLEKRNVPVGILLNLFSIDYFDITQALPLAVSGEISSISVGVSTASGT
ncbi:MAG: hypothetical protein WCI95_01125 [bacterium]